MRLCLIVENGKSKGTRVEIPESGELIVGRDPKAGLRLPDVMASRHHFQVSSGPDGCFVRDLGSQNGTFVNDLRLEKETSLQIGDMIHAGETSMSLLAPESKGLVGKEISGYRLLERVGQGGMGTVFRANQLSLNREVAFKVLASRLCQDETFVDLFVKEARAAGALNHPNIVQVYDVGRNRGIYYFSMEFMAFGSVQDRLNREGKIPWTEAVRIILDAARGLEYAQRKGVVHRDIKPDNLMIAEDGTVKIADLGLAHRSDEAAAAGGEGILGTPHFISPEQAQGKPVDVRSDLYSLGGTFYRMITGRNPFSGRKVREIILAQIREAATPVNEVDPTIPREVGAIVQRMMEKEPDDRYQTPGELIDDLERIWGNGNGALATGGRGKMLAIGGGAGLIVLVLLFVLFSGGNSNPAPEPDPGKTNPDPTPASPTVTSAGKTEVENPVKPDPEAIKLKRELEAKEAFLEVEGDRKLGEPDRLKRFQTVAAKHAGTEYGTKAAEEARIIEQAIKEREDHKRKRIRDLNQAWAGARSEVENLAQAMRFAEADAQIVKFIEGQAKVEGLDLTPDANRLRQELKQNARKMYLSLKEQADKLAGEERFDEAIRLLGDFADKAARGPAPERQFSVLAKSASNAVKTYGKAKVDLLERRYKADRKRLIEGYRRAHRAALAYEFNKAHTTLIEARNGARCASYRRRFDAMIAAYAAIQDLQQAFIDRAGQSERIKNRKVPLDCRMLRQESGTLMGADEVFVHVQVFIQGKKQTLKRPWSKYPSGKFLQLFTDDRWDMSANEMKAVAYLAAELGSYAVAAEFAAKTGDEALIASVEREQDASEIYREALQSLEGRAWSGVVSRTARLRSEFADTSFFVRHTNGTTAMAPEPKK
jgi:serine/threonine protein kinase